MIRQLQRGQFGRRSERLDPDQLQLGLEDLEQTARRPRRRRRRRPQGAGHPSAAPGSATQPGRLAGAPAAGRGPGRRRGQELPLLRREPAPDRRGHERDARHRPGPAAGEGDPPPALWLPGLRGGGGAGARPGAADHRRDGDRGAAGARAGEPSTPIFLPLYRQAQIFARQGIELDRSTLCDWVGRACWWLEPLWRLLRRHVMGSTRIFADDTPLPVLDPGRGRTKTGRLWGYAIDDRPWSGSTPPAVVYLYAEDRKGEHPAAHLAEFQGILQVDGYGGFKSLLENRPPGAIRLAFCWAHCRRRFYEIHQATGSPLAEEALRRIGELYCDRGRDPRPPRRGAARGPAGAQPADRGRPACLAHGPAGAGLGQVRPGRGDPLRPAPLAGAGAVPRGRPARARHQHHRAGDPADRLGPQE